MEWTSVLHEGYGGLASQPAGQDGKGLSSVITAKWESVEGVLHGFGRLNISHLIMLRKIKFYKHFVSFINQYII